MSLSLVHLVLSFRLSLLRNSTIESSMLRISHNMSPCQCTKMTSIVLAMTTMIMAVNAQICETVAGNSWDGLTDALDQSYGFAILCPFRISGGDCPKDTKGYVLKEASLYAMCDSISSTEAACVIDCPQTHFTVFPGTALTLDGMTLTGSKSSAIQVKPNGQLTTYNAIFSNNYRESGNGGAIEAAEGSDLSLMYSSFDNNQALNGGAVYHLGAAVVSGSHFIDNHATNGGGGAIFSGSRATTELSENLFAGNRATFFAPAIFDGSDTQSDQERNSACDNTIDGGTARCDGIYSIQNGIGSCQVFDDRCVPPTAAPTTATPSELPSFNPVSGPSAEPSYAPTDDPSTSTTVAPTLPPSNRPSLRPSQVPSSLLFPSQTPSITASLRATSVPSNEPSMVPNSLPTTRPSQSQMPSLIPTGSPSTTLFPSQIPSGATSDHQPSHFPSGMSSPEPSEQPTLSTFPTGSPTQEPSNEPSFVPTLLPTSQKPSTSPSSKPSTFPSGVPSNVPSVPPSKTPTVSPSDVPSSLPSTPPSNDPSTSPSLNPSRPKPSPLPTPPPTLFTISNDMPTTSGTYSYTHSSRPKQRRRGPT